MPDTTVEREMIPLPMTIFLSDDLEDRSVEERGIKIYEALEMLGNKMTELAVRDVEIEFRFTDSKMFDIWLLLISRATRFGIFWVSIPVDDSHAVQLLKYCKQCSHAVRGLNLLTPKNGSSGDLKDPEIIEANRNTIIKAAGELGVPLKIDGKILPAP